MNQSNGSTLLWKLGEKLTWRCLTNSQVSHWRDSTDCLRIMMAIDLNQRNKGIPKTLVLMTDLRGGRIWIKIKIGELCLRIRTYITCITSISSNEVQTSLVLSNPNACKFVFGNKIIRESGNVGHYSSAWNSEAEQPRSTIEAQDPLATITWCFLESVE